MVLENKDLDPVIKASLQKFQSDIMGVMRSQDAKRRNSDAKNRHDQDGTYLFAFIRMNLKQSGLDDSQNYDVFQDAYERGINTIIKRNQVIEYPLAWMRATSYRIILELRRGQSKYKSVDDYDQIQPEAQVEAQATIDAREIAWRAFQQLNPRDREILKYRILQNMPWKEVHQHLYLSNKPALALSEEALRQQGSRALKHLREKYQEISYSGLFV